MNIVPVALGISIGFSLFAGFIFMIIGFSRRPRDMTLVTFALSALAIGGNAVSVLLIHKASSLEGYIAAFKIGFGPFALLVIVALLWFVAFYTGVKPRGFLLVMSLWFTVIVVLQMSLPFGILFAEVSGLRTIFLPWGEQIVIHQATAHPWRPVVDLFFFVMIGFFFYETYRQYRRGERQRALLLGLAIFLFLLANIHDSLVDIGVINFIYILEFAFLSFVTMMSLQLTSEILQTESELKRYQGSLEALVDERTTELEQSNLQLKQENILREQVEKSLRQSERQARALLNAPPDTAMLLSPEGIILETNEIGAQRLGVSLAEAIGTNAFELFEPSIAEIRWKKAEEVLASKQAVRWEDERDGKHYANNLYPILDENEAVISLAVFAADITGRKRVEEALRLKIEDLNVLNQVGHVVTSAMDMPVALQRIAEIISGHFQARYSHIILQEEKEEGLMVLMGYDRESGSIKPTNLDISLGSLPLVNDVMTTGESLVISDPQSLSLPPDVCDFLQEHHIQGVILVPLRIIGAVSGIMVVSHDQPGRSFTKDEVLLAETIADDVSRTVEIARLQEQEKKAAAAEERSRLARDLHDSVTQTMYSVSIVAEALPRLLNRDIEQAKSTAAALRQMTLGALAEMRTLLFELRPAALEKASMSNLLGQLGDILTGQNHIP
ncbi:MAG: GAF domain-containing protein, partial [Anaerolineales bacterium]|nr:GAF domain-containing protein [Anaerolineales bacterium]